MVYIYPTKLTIQINHSCKYTVRPMDGMGNHPPPVISLEGAVYGLGRCWRGDRQRCRGTGMAGLAEGGGSKHRVIETWKNRKHHREMGGISKFGMSNKFNGNASFGLRSQKL